MTVLDVQLDPELTEMVEIEPDRVDGVLTPANGFPTLMIKALADEPVEKRDVSTDERKRLAAEGKALDDGSYPIANAGDLDNAAKLARSGHGNVSAAKRLIAKRAKELGVANPLDDDNDAKKGAEDETTEVVEPQEDAQEAQDVQKELIDAAVAKAMESRDEAIKELRDELAKVKATPIPGGPVMTVPASVRVERDRNEQLAKAAHYERMAGEVNEPDLRAHYTRQAEAARVAAGR